MEIALRGHGVEGGWRHGGGGCKIFSCKILCGAIKVGGWGSSGGLCISYFVFCCVFLILCGATKVGGQGDSGGQM